jgi:hypothetical protein
MGIASKMNVEKEREREREWKLREEDSLPPPKKNEREKHTDTGRQFGRPVVPLIINSMHDQ